MMAPGELRRDVGEAYGPDALLWRFADQADEAAFEACRRRMQWLETAGLPGLVEIVPAFTSILICYGAVTSESASSRWKTLVSLWEAASRPGPQAPQDGPSNKDPAFREMSRDKHASTDEAAPDSDADRNRDRSKVHEIPVVYDGPDMARVAASSGLSEAEVARRHAASLYRVHCIGFCPGFPYLGGMDPALVTARLDQPRPRIPAGSVAIGGEHTGIYPITSPGGWNLIGRTSRRLFLPETGSGSAMFPVAAGDRIRFIGVDRLPLELIDQDSDKLRHSGGTLGRVEVEGQGIRGGGDVLRILRLGAGITVQDAGRSGWRRFGMPGGGWMDPVAAEWANRLMGNPLRLPVLELAGAGHAFEAIQDGWISVAGAGRVRTADHQVRGWATIRVRSGERFVIEPGTWGLWTYLGISGGIRAPRILGSVSTYSRAGLGWIPAVGDVICAGKGEMPAWMESVAGRHVAPGVLTDWERPKRVVRLKVWPAPQWGMFSEEARNALVTKEWRVSALVDRVGYRLNGPDLKPPTGSMISEPVLPGSIQVPPGGQPVVTFMDGPTLGGYPKLGLVDPGDLWRLGQTPPGGRVRFKWV